VPVIAQIGQLLNSVPRLGRIVGQQLVRDNLVQRDVQPGLTGTPPTVISSSMCRGAFELWGLRLDQEHEFGLATGRTPWHGAVERLLDHLQALVGREAQKALMCCPWQPGCYWRGRKIT
jgi:hypothetical protein